MSYLGATPLTDNPAALAAMKNSDLVLDLMLLLFSPEQMEILESGTKILLAVEPPEVLVRAVPTEADQQARAGRVEAAQEGQEDARSLAGRHGRDVPARRISGHHRVRFLRGIRALGPLAERLLFTFANEGGSDGTIVIDRGDILLPQKNYVSDKITMNLSGGFVRSIEGDVDAALLREFMEAYKDLEAYAIAHIGWGMQPRCYWHTLSLMDREATTGQDARRSKATSCSPWARTTRPAALAPRLVTSTFRCATARWRWMTSSWFATAR